MDTQIEALIQELNALTEKELYPNPHIRSAIVQKLSNSGERIVEPLIAVMKEGAQMRQGMPHGFLTLQAYIAIEVLGQLHDPRAFEPLVEFMKTDAFVLDRQHFGDALIQYGKANTLPILIDILQNCYCDNEIVPSNISDEEWNVFVIAGLLFQIGDPRGLQAIREKQVQDGKLYGIQPKFLGEEKAYTEFLIDALGSENAQWRAGAARLLGELNVQHAAPHLIQQLKTDPSPIARVRAAYGLWRLKWPEAVVHLMIASIVETEHDAHFSSRIAVAAILGLHTLTPEAEMILSTGIRAFGERELCQILLDALQKQMHLKYCEGYLNLCIPLMSHEIRRDVLYPALMELTHHPATEVAEVARRLIDPSTQSVF